MFRHRPKRILCWRGALSSGRCWTKPGIRKEGFLWENTANPGDCKMEVKEIAISQIKGSLCKMRLEKDYEKEEMVESIGECGVMNPVKVKKVKDGYLIFTGHRRLECAKELGEKIIQAEIWEDIPDKEAVLMGFVDNINRKDFTSCPVRVNFHRGFTPLVLRNAALARVSPLSPPGGKQILSPRPPNRFFGFQ